MGIVFGETYLAQTQPHEHPESPARMAAIVMKLGELGLLDDAVEPEPATVEELAPIHDANYVNTLQAFGEGYLDPDTYLMPDGFQLALNAAGGAMTAMRSAVKDKKPYFALTRPPGHHASKARSGGFCFLNNAALAAAAALPKAKRVAIVDYDVHHGNGTSDIFYANGDVLYISTHQWGIYPGTGHYTEAGYGKGKGYTINIPLPSGCGDSTFRAAFDEVIAPAVTKFKPGAMVVSLGADAHYKDYLASLTLSTPGYVSLCADTVGLAKKVCGSKIAFVLEGGYNPQALAEVVAGVIKSFSGEHVDSEFNDVSDTEMIGRQALDCTKGVHAEKWGL